MNTAINSSGMSSCSHGETGVAAPRAKNNPSHRE
jgi:hypothetical protein